MKKFLPLFLILFFTSPKVFAQDIVTGDASAKSTVTNEVSGNANVYTKIEVEANGEKKVLETTEPGEHRLEVSSNSNASADAEVIIEEDANISLNGKDKDEEDTEVTGFNPVNFIEKVLEGLADFFKGFLSIF